VYTITKTFELSAAHRLVGLPADHPCGRMHGHNYVVKVFLKAERLDQHGFVRDYHELDEFKKHLSMTCDHRVLNDYMPGDTNPTAENLARLFYRHLKDYFPELTAVGVSETPKTWAMYDESA
jgi:6-pyruvoyltetrahydropterin/6-carboxytetrahydropterin synthase